MTQPIFIVALILAFVGIANGIAGNYILGPEQDHQLASDIAKLDKMDLDTIDTYEKYKEFADSTNNLITILNQKESYEIPYLKTTQESWFEVSKKINKYSPLINNYNNLIVCSENYECEYNEATRQEFYLATGKFSLETAIIGITLFHSVAYQTAGALYRASGMTQLAFKCPSCVSTVLSSSYWPIKTILVEESSVVADKLFDIINKTSVGEVS